MSGHTKAPWSLGFEGGGITGPTVPRIEGPCVGGREQKYTIVTVPEVFGCQGVLAICPEQTGSPGSADANARLITAAPDLLEALITALPYVEETEPDPAYSNGVVRKVINQMRAAIAKAEGV